MFNVEEAKNKIINIYDFWCESALQCYLNKDELGKRLAINNCRLIADIMKIAFNDDFLINQCFPKYNE